MAKPTKSYNDPFNRNRLPQPGVAIETFTGGILERRRIENSTPELFVELAKRYPEAAFLN